MSGRDYYSSRKELQDFDDGANDLWTLYRNRVKNVDQTRIKTLKDDMDGILIFVSSIFYG